MPHDHPSRPHSHDSAHGVPDAHGHDHGVDASGATTRATLVLALALTGAYAAVEAFAGWWSGSLALLSDAGHMLT
ncbi:MAG: cation transporter, partial [Betaproteobacteria bacterium]